VEDRPLPENVVQVKWKGGGKSFQWRDLPALAFDFRRLTRQLKPDLVHAGPIQTCALIAILSGFRPVLTMSWGFDLMDDINKGKIWEWATRYTLKRSSFFTSDANVTRDKAVAYGMDQDKTIVFPWGVDLDHFKPSSGLDTPHEERAGLLDHQDNNIFTLFCNRSWEARYGVDVLARAFVKVAKKRDDVNLLLLGGGSQGNVIRGILQNGGVLDHVNFGGQVSQTDLLRWYHMADLYISPSHVDGSSVSLMEALACGLPCLVSDIPANKEWIVENENGWLFRDGDVDQLAEKVVEALNSRREFKRMGKLARKTAEEKADWKINSSKLLDAYELMVGIGKKK
jgi:glycosyltransferase involved in cell wall biosynthesis